MPRADVIIIGAGLAGLACASRLVQSGVLPVVLESADDIGGRVRTDKLNGFLLDRGFQVLLTAYPAARQMLDYSQLQLKYFEPGALIYSGGRFHRLSDPWRQPRYAIASLMSPIGTFPDKLRVARLRWSVCKGTLDTLLKRDETTTIDYLRNAGFSSRIIEQFFRPFLGGIFLERELSTSSRMFEFVFRMFATGRVALPAHGMMSIPRQLTKKLPEGSVRLNTRVSGIRPGRVTLASGESIDAEAVVIAVNGPEAARLLRDEMPTQGVSVTCVYFDAPASPVEEPILVLNGTGEGPVNNFCVPSQISSRYAPEGRALISASVLGDPPMNNDELENAVIEQLTGWFGNQVRSWKHLRTYRITDALPNQEPGLLPASPKNPHLEERIYICGDHCETGSLQGALASGQRAAQALLGDYSGDGKPK